MPLYEYRCENCEHQFEIIQRFSDPPVTECPACGQGPVVKLLSSPAIQFKGSGWYITDYARKDGDRKTPAGDTGAPAKTEGGGAGTGAAAAPSAGATGESKPAAPAAASKKE